MAQEYKEVMLNNIIQAIENTGANDSGYDEKQRSIDALENLERMLAYGIAAICPDRNMIKEVCEDSAFAVKKFALAFEEYNNGLKTQGQPVTNKIAKQNLNPPEKIAGRPDSFSQADYSVRVLKK